MEALQAFGSSHQHSVLDPSIANTALPSVQGTKNDAATIDSISDADKFFYLDPYLRPYNDECGETDLKTQDVWICNLGLQGDKHVPAIPAIYQLDSNSGRAVYVCGVPFNYTDEQFRDMLNEYGTIVRCPVIIDTLSQETFRWAVMQTKIEATELLQISKQQQKLTFKITAYIALPPGRSQQLAAAVAAEGNEVKSSCSTPVGFSFKDSAKHFPTLQSHSIWQSRINLPPISSYLKTQVPRLKHLPSLTGCSEAFPSKKRRLERTINWRSGQIKTYQQSPHETSSAQNSLTNGLFSNQKYDSGLNNDFFSSAVFPYTLSGNSFRAGTPQHHLHDNGVFPRAIQTQGIRSSDPWYSPNISSFWPYHTSEHLHNTFEVSNPDHFEQNESRSVDKVISPDIGVKTTVETFEVKERETASSKLDSPPLTTDFSSAFKSKLAARDEQEPDVPAKSPPASTEFLPQAPSWARIASKASPEARIIDLHASTKASNTSTSTFARLKSTSRASAVFSARSYEPITEQMRVVFLLDLPHTLTLEDVSAAVREGPLRSIHFGTDEEKNSRYAAVVFQLARDAAAFASALLKERVNSRPDRFRFVVDVVRGEEPFPLDDVLRAMGPPLYATRRLTLVKASFFFMFGERQLRLLCDKVVGEAAVQLVWIYNGGNATIVFADVGSAMLFKAELDNYAATAGQPSGQSAMWSGLSTTYSKDPCIAPLELKTAMHD